MASPVDEFRAYFQYTNRAWDPTIWPRAFWFDVFLSHRRSDWSRSLADTLAGAGVKAYHDGDQPAAEEQVLVELDAALQHSRFIAVCLSENAATSAYCRAEFLPAIEHAWAHGIPRVLVVTNGQALAAPAELVGLPVLDVSSPSGLAAFIDHVQGGNRVTFASDDGDVLADDEASFRALCESIGDESIARRAALHQRVPTPEWDDLGRAVVGVGVCVLHVLLQQRVDDRALFIFKKRIEREDTLDRESLRYLAGCAQILMRLGSSDDRFLASELLAWLGQRDGVPDESRVLTAFVRHHTMRGGDPRVCRLLLSRVAAAPGLLAFHDIERMLATYPFLFTDGLERLADNLPVPVKAKLGIPGLSRAMLPAWEDLSLVRRRLGYLREQLDTTTPPTSLDIEIVLEDQLAAARRGRAGAVPPEVLADHGRAILSELSDRNAAGLSLLSQLEVEGILNMRWFVYDVCACEPGRTARIIEPIASAVGDAGYPRTADAIRALIPQLEGGGPVNDEMVDKGYMLDDLEIEHARRSRR